MTVGNEEEGGREEGRVWICRNVPVEGWHQNETGVCKLEVSRQGDEVRGVCECVWVK